MRAPCFLAFCLLWLTAVDSLAASPSLFPELRPGSLYVGENGRDGLRLKVKLYLLRGNLFVLRQEFSKGKQRFDRDMTGFWRQMGNGALLQLNNRHGLALRLNMGGTGNLYGDFPSLGGSDAQSIVLRESPLDKPVFTLMGRLERDGAAARMTDSATGHACMVREEALTALPPLPGAPVLFVDAVIRLTPDSWEVERIRSFSQHLPGTGQKDSVEDFAAQVLGRVWHLALPDHMTVSCTFTEHKLEIAGPGLWLMVGYQLEGRNICFTPSPKDKAMLQSLGLSAVRELLAAVSWSLEGELLVLTGADGHNFLLQTP
ncbi:MAG: hypothetical protein Q4F27_01540 [Desulfovibrionaceae bacterium]|nr:hypothetical protein [Desulfovibrionaceae bacterium]